MTVRALMLTVLLAIAGGWIAPATASAQGAAGKAASMIQPESLPQGFILVVEDKTKLAGTASPIYLAGNVNGWNPADTAFKLAGRSDMRWQIQLAQPKGVDKMEFKFTRGTWELEELDPNLNKIGNRTLPLIDASKLKPGEVPIIELSVDRWGDERPEYRAKKALSPYRELNVAGTVRRLQVVGGGASDGGGGMMRDALVWLPPGYADSVNANVTYPVLYLQDGQNVFEQSPVTPSEWKADETAMQLIKAGRTRPFIIVAIPHAGDARIREYLPVPAGEFKVAGGDAYVDWLVGTVMPRVERSFRVATGPENTAIGGASLGATISLHAAKRHPGVFGGVLLESMPFKLGGDKLWQDYLASVERWPARVAIGMGAMETGDAPEKQATNLGYVTAARDLAKRLQAGGTGMPEQVVLDIGPDDKHNEEAWARRLPAALEFLFPPLKN